MVRQAGAGAKDPVRRVDDSERRARLGRRHVLADRGDDDATRVAGAVVGLHGTDPATVVLSARARVADLTVDGLEAALYDERTLLRTLGMRRTMWVTPLDLAAEIQASCTNDIVARERAAVAKLVEGGGVTDDGNRWLDSIADDVDRHLAKVGQATGAELSKAVPTLAAKVSMGEGKTWGAVISMSTRALFVLAGEGRIARGKPKGTWVSSQYRWTSMAAWLPAGVAVLDKTAASTALVGRWLRAYGPGTGADLAWWTGWPLGRVRSALTALDAVPVTLADESTAYLLPDDVDPVETAPPWVALLPALDPAPMGWQGRDWYLGGHRAALFDYSGNIGPTVWVDGRIVGGWAHRKDGRVAVRLLEKVPKATERAIAERAEELSVWIGDVRVRSRFPTPTERELYGEP